MDCWKIWLSTLAITRGQRNEARPPTETVLWPIPAVNSDGHLWRSTAAITSGASARTGFVRTPGAPANEIHVARGHRRSSLPDTSVGIGRAS